MPYIVTTKRPCPACVHGPAAGGEHRPESVSRRAVATLDEAKTRGYGIIDAALPFASATWRTLRADVYALPGSGGTVGPLPDGTLIEVEAVELGELWRRAGADNTLISKPDRATIDAFNARGFTVGRGS